jgi:ribosomal protein S18 acetylase RimI-like enzyme
MQKISVFTKSFTTGIHRAGQEDKEAVMAILKQTKFFRPEELKVAEEVFDDSISGDPKNDYQSFVARQAHKTIGWVCFGPTPCTVGTFDIYWIAVNPEHQNTGVGTSLVQYAVTTIKNSNGRMIVVETSGTEHYLTTRRFYEKLGFCPQLCIKDFYAVGDDKIIYIKKV